MLISALVRRAKGSPHLSGKSEAKGGVLKGISASFGAMRQGRQDGTNQREATEEGVERFCLLKFKVCEKSDAGFDCLGGVGTKISGATRQGKKKRKKFEEGDAEKQKGGFPPFQTGGWVG